MQNGRPHPILPLRGEGTSKYPLLLGEDKGEVYLNNTSIRLASLTTNDPLKIRSEYSVPCIRHSRESGNPEKEQSGFRVKHGMTEGNYQSIQPASLTTDNFEFSFPPDKGDVRGFIGLPLKRRGTRVGRGPREL